MSRISSDAAGTRDPVGAETVVPRPATGLGSILSTGMLVVMRVYMAVAAGVIVYRIVS